MEEKEVIKTVKKKSTKKTAAKVSKKSAKKTVSKEVGTKVSKKTKPSKSVKPTVSVTGRNETLDVRLYSDKGVSSLSVKEQIALQKSNRSNILIRGILKEGKGEITNPESGGYKIIINPISIDRDTTKNYCKKIFNRWQSSESSYKRLFAHFQGDLTKVWGRVDYISVQSDTVVASCVCLDEDGNLNDEAFKKAIVEIASYAKYNSGNAHIERFGDWDSILPILTSFLTDYSINLYIY